MKIQPKTSKKTDGIIMAGFRLPYFPPLKPALVVLGLLLLIPVTEKAQQPDPDHPWTVVIDAGHGGKDPGALGKLSKEKDIVLKIALKLGEYIRQNLPAVRVIYTRTDDTFIPLNQRSQIANDSLADLFISIHCNAAPNHRVWGTETYVMGLHRSKENLDVAMRENAVISYEEDYSVKYEGYDPSSAESFIIFSMLQNAFLDQSLDFANLLQTDFQQRAKRRNRGVRQAGFLVLWKTSMPSVLVEVGYISNPKEEKYLRSAKGQDYIASSIFRSLKAYKAQLDSFARFSQKNITPIPPQQNRYPTTKDSIEFKIQIFASTSEITLPADRLDGLPEVAVIKTNGIFKYCLGSYSSFSEASRQNQLVKRKFPDSFVIALKAGKQIPLKEAISLTSASKH